jgi:hypothetical protein
MLPTGRIGVWLGVEVRVTVRVGVGGVLVTGGGVDVTITVVEPPLVGMMMTVGPPGREVCGGPPEVGVG